MEPNGTATLICEMVEESTTATWLKDGAVLKADNRIEMISEKRTQKLIIHKVTSSDSGEYTCKVGNVSTTARLIVEGKLENLETSILYKDLFFLFKISNI